MGQDRQDRQDGQDPIMEYNTLESKISNTYNFTFSSLKAVKNNNHRVQINM